MCGYQGHEFGAHYPDSCCIEGYLWDADSCDEPGGALHSGGEWPCPACNTDAYLDAARDEAKDGGCGKSMGVPWCAALVWENHLLKARRENEAVTDAWLAKCRPFKTDDWPDRRAVYEYRASWEKTIARRWPWPLPPITKAA